MSSYLAVQSDIKEKVDRLEKETACLPQTVVEVQHDISGGMYSRTGVIPAGTTFFGAIHKKDHLNVICGDVTVLTDAGPVRYTGYHVIKTQAGSKRVAVAHANTAWTTVLRTDLTNIRDIEDECVEGSENLQTRMKEIECS